MAPSVRLLPNIVEIQESLHALFYRSYGLRLEHFIVDGGHTRVACWVPASHGKPVAAAAAADDDDDEDSASVRATPGASPTSPMTAERRRRRKPPLLLIHGFGASSLNHWVKQIQVLSRHFELYIPSLVFFFSSTSASQKRRGEFFQADAMLQLMDALGVERCQVVGLSYGGIVAYRMATLAPARVARLAMAGSGVMMNRAEYDALIERWGVSTTVPLFLPRTPAELLRLIGMAHRVTPYLPEWILQDAVDRFFENREEKAELLEDLREQRAKGHPEYPVPQMETLIVWGEDDAVFPISIGYRMHKCFGACSRLVVFEKGSHALQADDTDHFNHTILHFLLHGNASPRSSPTSPAAAAAAAATAAFSPALLSAGAVAVAAGAAALAAGAVAAMSAATVVQ
ncbi:hypothetical protein CLOM_g22483 [Closterium sp. NIES-68]|nr:hypothetical protein CLOM_g22483 [Closterium sp. NIES-68]